MLGGEVVPVLRKELESAARPRGRRGPHPREPRQGEVRRRRAAPAAPQRQPRRQRHRILALPGHARGHGRRRSRRCSRVGAADAIAIARTDERRDPRPRIEREANEAWEALLGAHTDAHAALRGRGHVVRGVAARVRRALHAVQVPQAAAAGRPGRARAAQPAGPVAARGAPRRARLRRQCPDPADARATLLSLTEEGREVQRRVGRPTPVRSPTRWPPASPPTRCPLSRASPRGWLPLPAHRRMPHDHPPLSLVVVNAGVSDPSSTNCSPTAPPLACARSARRAGARSPPR